MAERQTWLFLLRSKRSLRIGDQEVLRLDIYLIIYIVKALTGSHDRAVRKTCLDVAEIACLLRELMSIDLHREVALAVADVVLSDAVVSDLIEAGVLASMVGADDDADHLMADDDGALQRVVGLLDVLRIDEAVGLLPEERKHEMRLVIALHVVVGEREVELRILDVSDGLHRERLVEACEEERELLDVVCLLLRDDHAGSSRDDVRGKDP